MRKFKIFASLFIAGVILLTNVTQSLALSDEQKKVLDSGVFYFNVAQECAAPDPTATGATPNIDLKKIAEQYGLQSAMAKQINGDVVDTYKSDEAPEAASSVLKLLIADVLLHKKPDLNQTITIKSSQLYGPADAKAGDQLKLKDVIQRTLSEEDWNTGANIMIDLAGGFADVTEGARNLGYKNTKIVSYYHDPPAGRNLTTVADLTKAMEDIFTTNDSYFKAAQDALKGVNHYNISPKPLASKWGGTSKVAGNSAVFDIGGKRFIVTLYINGNQADVKDELTDASEDIVTEIKKGVSPDASTAGSACCSAEGSGNLVGNSNEEKTWNFFKSKGLSNKQTAGIMGNMLQESHFDPQIIQGGGRSKNPSDAGGGGWGIIQWTPGSKIVGMAKTAGVKGDIWELKTQLDLVWQHMHNNPIVTKSFDLDYFKTITSEVEASKYFGLNIEGFGIEGERNEFATTILHKYEGAQDGASDVITDITGGDCSQASAPGQDTKFVDGFTVYMQCDPDWANKNYSSSTICKSGCGPSAMAMIITNLKGQKVTPVETSNYAASRGMYVPGVGSSWSIAPVLARHWGLKSKAIGADASKIAATLQAGGLVIASGQGPEPFTSGGHYIVIRAVTDSGKWKVGDSAHADANDKEWDPQQLLSNMNGGSVYAISK